jgi:flagellar biosynthetic protein FliP
LKLAPRSLIAFLLVLALLCARAPAQDPAPSKIPDLGTPAAGQEGAPEGLSGPLQIVLVLTVLALAPAILMTATSFTRILIVLSFIRRALSVPELPPNQVLVGLSLFLTLLVMKPVISDVNEQALQPYLKKTITLAEAGNNGGEVLGRFLIRHARQEDVKLFVDLTHEELPAGPENVPLTVLIPAFALSELRTAFQMGFLVYLPFLILDLVISSVLLSMGMFMLPPVIISTPFKILLFVLVDGWDLVVKSLVESFHP